MLISTFTNTLKKWCRKISLRNCYISQKNYKAAASNIEVLCYTLKNVLFCFFVNKIGYWSTISVFLLHNLNVTCHFFVIVKLSNF